MAKPIVDMFSWNAPGNTLQDLYNWYLADGDEDAGGGGGITNVYYPQQGGDGAFDYLNNPVAPVTTSGTGEQIVANKALRDLGYANPWAGEIGPYYEGYGDDMLPAIGEDEEEAKFLDSPFAWAKQKWGALPPGIQKTGIAAALSAIHPLAGVLPFLPKSEGYRMGGLDAMGKGLYNTLAAEGMLFEHSTGLKTGTGKNLVFGDTLIGNNYVEGQQEIWDKYYAGKDPEEIEAELKAYAKKHKQSDWRKTYKGKRYFESKAVTNYMDDFKTVRGVDIGAPIQVDDVRQIVKPTITGPDIIPVGGMLPGGQHEIAAPIAPAPVYTGGVKSPAHPSRDGGVGQQTAGRADPSWEYDPFAKGGRVGYGTGGIVDLL